MKNTQLSIYLWRNFYKKKSFLIKSKSGCCKRLKQGEDTNKKNKKIKIEE